MIPLISVALCTFNGAKYLRQQLDSILNQTYELLEVIIVDDCSIDDTRSIIQQYARVDPRINFFFNDTNLGFNKNFEKALLLASGNYIAISDQDDIWDKEKLSILYNGIGDNWLAFSNSSYINEVGELTGKTLLENFNLSGKTFISFIEKNYVSGHTILFNRIFMEYILPFPAYGFYDWWMGYIAIYHNKLVYIDAILTLYRQHELSVIKQIYNIDDARLMAISVLELRIEELHALEEYKHLSKAEQSIITDFKKALQSKRKGRFSVIYIKLICKHYCELFPERRFRRGLSKLNFAIKYARSFK
jgi:glycosyltransferase involved in cell wall biosynthesis